ncbi:hypothetical protein IAQ61_011818 [Plenodomus lingam]|uniref:uncharacterized protein n=1 Tax=Leptosphaeria maculans TaxID=5022 RepID=UPI00331C4A8D|nr:hypothetical protein IAQ61_011818 [Plenodomus lingam]
MAAPKHGLLVAASSRWSTAFDDKPPAPAPTPAPAQPATTTCTLAAKQEAFNCRCELMQLFFVV